MTADKKPDPAERPVFIRESFTTVYAKRLFSAAEVCDIVEEQIRSLQNPLTKRNLTVGIVTAYEAGLEEGKRQATATEEIAALIQRTKEEVLKEPSEDDLGFDETLMSQIFRAAIMSLDDEGTNFDDDKFRNKLKAIFETLRQPPTTGTSSITDGGS